KRCDLTKQLQKSFLRKVLSGGGIARHPQAQRIHTTLMQVVEDFESLRITLLGPLYCLSFGELVALWPFRGRQVAFPAALGLMRHKVPFVVPLRAEPRIEELRWLAA